jgi:hypothetical protein
MIADGLLKVYALAVAEPLERKVFWAIVVVVGIAFLYPSDLNPFKQKSPDWKVIKEAVAASVYCTDSDTNDEGDTTIGYAPCVKLSNVTYDTTLGNEYCYTADVSIGGYAGETYQGISSWQFSGNEYYCVKWSAKYTDSDMNNPSDWRITFINNSPADIL